MAIAVHYFMVSIIGASHDQIFRASGASRLVAASFADDDIMPFSLVMRERTL